MSKRKQDEINRLRESLARFPPGSDMRAEIVRQLAIRGVAA